MGRDDLSEDALARSLTEVLGAQGIKAPQVVIEWVESIPKTAAGKAPLIKAYR